MGKASIVKITLEHENMSKSFFILLSKEHILEKIQMLDSSKATQWSDIPVKLIRSKSDFFAEKILKYFNESLEKSKFPDRLKSANVTPSLQEECTYLKK